MPITGKYTWDQTQESVTISIPFKGKSLKKVDVFLAESVLKVSHPPFLLDLTFPNEVDVDRCRALHRSNCLFVYLQKLKPGLWDDISFHGSKDKVSARRREAIKKREDRLRSCHEKALLRRQKEERASLKNQMDLDQDEFQRIQSKKSHEKNEAEKAMYKSFEEFQDSQHDKSKAICIVDQKSVQQRNEKLNLTKVPRQGKVPGIRAVAKLSFKHTTRIFKTPSRESTRVQEDKFIADNQPFLWSNKHFNNFGSDIADSDPMWLKKKGDTFYEGGDFMSALSAYSAALDKDCSFIHALANRAVTFLSMGDHVRCIDDCQKALSLLDIEKDHSLDESNQMRRKLFLRLGYAYCHFGSFRHNTMSRQFLDKALGIEKSDETSIKHLDALLCASDLKLEADNEFGKGALEEAIILYLKALSKENNFLSALSNCASAYFLLGKMQECIQCCTKLLSKLKKKKLVHREAFTNSKVFCIPPYGSDDRKMFVITTLCKRGIARAKLNNFQIAASDLKEASNVVKGYKANCYQSLAEDVRFLEGKRETHL
jgi:dyslexia susceptibility 1 candidate gene 1 protein